MPLTEFITQVLIAALHNLFGWALLLERAVRLYISSILSLTAVEVMILLTLCFFLTIAVMSPLLAPVTRLE